MQVSPGRRLTRAAAGAAASTFAALGSHVLAGAPMPPLSGILIPLALAFAICVQFAGRARSLWRLSLAVGLSQAAYHVVFSWSAAQATLAVDSAAHHVAAGDVIVISHAGHGGAEMSAAHVGAALATIIVMRRAETSWNALAVAARAAVHRIASRWLAPAPTVFAPLRASLVTPRPRIRALAPVRTGPAVLRGPPAISL
ncbi:hypothetical protein [Demequina sp. NBRC 110052]|uniref:hypothetical protein n=1 Tax=Demequina sp. NBRC 110052 TaxID=1570341 RepID=UPI0013562B10|nr:hypothetical protein [Demequina sp. NBRC 110052]